MDFGRLITAMVTPFDQEGNIDWTVAEQLIEYLIVQQKTDSIVVAGTTGEAPTLSQDEKVELFKFVVKKAAGRVKVIAGTGSNNTKGTIELSKLAEQCGVDALLVVAPYYSKPSQEGLYLHFKAIAESVNTPIVIYNVEGRTAVNISVETTLRLAHECKNIVATKDCAKLEQLALIAAGAPEGFKVYSGDDSATLPALSVGAYGIISVASHIVGAEMAKMIQLYLEGKVQEAGAIHRNLLPVFTGLFTFPSPVPVKYALELNGVKVGSVRLPLAPINEEQKQFIRELTSVKTGTA